jgi:hypothetical protein
MMPVAKLKASSGVTPPRWPSRAARSMSSLSRLRATPAPGRIAQRLRDERPASGGDALDRIVQREAARLQEFVVFARQLVGDDALQIGEAVEMHIESALRHAGGADYVIHRHLIKGARRVKRPRRRKQLSAGARAAVAADLRAPGKVDSSHSPPPMPLYFSY